MLSLHNKTICVYFTLFITLYSYRTPVLVEKIVQDEDCVEEAHQFFSEIRTNHLYRKTGFKKVYYALKQHSKYHFGKSPSQSERTLLVEPRYQFFYKHQLNEKIRRRKGGAERLSQQQYPQNIPSVVELHKPHKNSRLHYFIP